MIHIRLDEIRRVGGYREFAIPCALASYVSAFWAYESPGRVQSPHRVLPDSGVSVGLRVDPDGRSRDVDAWAPFLFGPIRTVRTFFPAARETLVGVQVKPEWSRVLLGVAPEEHEDAQIPAEACLSRTRVASLRGTVRRTLRSRPPARDPAPGAARPTVCLDALVHWIAAQAEGARSCRATRSAHEALETLRGHPSARVEDAARRASRSTRQLRRDVLTVAGVGPKYLQRVDRMNRAVFEADRTPVPSWASIAAGHGYSDQPHLIREVSCLTGVTPRRLHEERRAEHVRFLQSVVSGDR